MAASLCADSVSLRWTQSALLSQPKPFTDSLVPIVCSRALRANLKIAISASLSLPHDLGDTSLLSSFLQVIVMLEGSRFLLSSTQTLSLALRSTRESKPVETAQKLMLKWVSRELKERQVASVEEYVANGVGDLVLLGLWSIVQDQVKEAETIPLWFFARDDRIQKCVPFFQALASIARGVASFPSLPRS